MFDYMFYVYLLLGVELGGGLPLLNPLLVLPQSLLVQALSGVERDHGCCCRRWTSSPRPKNSFGCEIGRPTHGCRLPTVSGSDVTLPLTSGAPVPPLSRGDLSPRCPPRVTADSFPPALPLVGWSWCPWLFAGPCWCC